VSGHTAAIGERMEDEMSKRKVKVEPSIEVAEALEVLICVIAGVVDGDEGLPAP